MTDSISDIEPPAPAIGTLEDLWAELARCEAAMEDLTQTAPNYLEDPVDRVIDKIRAFEPQVSVIGQVKAGKSTLLNTLVGRTDLLPSDVNPWTSVITALHVNPRHRPKDTAALFRFFDAHEWDRLVATGGRLGEMAARAGFEAEAETVRTQVGRMRQSTEARLGSEFAELLGGSRTFPAIEKDTIDRYICYGDPDDLANGATEGVYADITKSADLYIDLPGTPRGLCLRDTPGVNDTFMMREQITLNAIADSRVCVVVLSAHQALTTMDMALLRIICAVDARDVILFVNRIDELPIRKGTERIRASIEGTLERAGLGTGFEILFGSGHWASAAIAGTETLLPASRASLKRLAPEAEDLRAAALEASGVPALLSTIERRVVEGPGQRVLREVAQEIDAIGRMGAKIESMAERRGATAGTEAPEVLTLAEATREVALARYDASAVEIRATFRERLERAQATFAASAIEALHAHIASRGEAGSWSHDPADLRMMMKSAFSTSCTRLRREAETALSDISTGTADVMQAHFGIAPDLDMPLPETPVHRAPVAIARTISLDLSGPWWRRFWRFGARRAAEARYHDLILAETTPLVEALLTDHFDEAVRESRRTVETFAADQARFLAAVTGAGRSEERLSA